MAYAKAITATIIAFLGSLDVALPGGISGDDWIKIAVATLVAGGAVFAVPNKPAAPAGNVFEKTGSGNAGGGPVVPPPTPPPPPK